jgi:esterase/lipase superfamily enzyme
MNREYHKWWSWRLDRDMELLVFGHGGVPIVVFPSSQGRFFEFEDRGLIGAVAHKIDSGEIQLYCLDSVDAESWYNRDVPPRWRIARHVQYENYIMEEVLPFIRLRNFDPHLVSVGCSFGGYHAVNVALRHPDRFTGFLSMSGAFDLEQFSRRLLRPGRLLQHATPLPAEPLLIRGFSIATATTPISLPLVGTITAFGRARISRASWARKAFPIISISGTRGTAMTGRPGHG